MTKLVLEIEMPRKQALRFFAHLIGVNPNELANTEGQTHFSGTAIPSLFTLLCPATVKVVEDD